MSNSPLTEAGISQFVAAWYRALDFHVPLAEIYTLVADKGLDMQFPDGHMTDYATFKTWYDRVTTIFFDENHYVQTVKATISGDSAVVDIVVGWQASWWEAPAAKSKRVSMDATQRWTVRRSARNGYGIEIVSYNATVEPFKYAPGFARL
jgi:hypothetical protein